MKQLLLVVSMHGFVPKHIHNHNHGFPSSIYTGILFESLRVATLDTGFHLPSQEAQASLAAASSLLQWAIMPSSATAFQLTGKTLARQLNSIVKIAPTTKARREKMWAAFSKYVQSSEYRQLWCTLSNNASVQSSPLLNFYLTHNYLLHLLKTKFPLTNSDLSNAPVDMSADEESALRYVAGYMIRSLRAKIERSKPNLMEEMVLALYSFREDSEQCEKIDGESSEGEQPNWVKVVDRGGLFHCRMEFNLFLCAVEVALKKEMRQGNEAAMKAGFKDKLLLLLQEDEDVLFWWSTLCAITDVDNETSEALLPYIVTHYVTIRGFAFAGRWMEAFKQKNKKNLQRSKSLRNKLQTADTRTTS